MAARTARCRRSCFRAARFTRPVLTSVRTCASKPAVATNVPPHGAFRGFGAPQSIFALERHLDKVAHAVGLTPEEFRRRNFINEGETTATSQMIREKVDMDGLLDRAFELDGLSCEARTVRAREQCTAVASVKKGIGFASFMHGAGFTGSGEVYLQSVVGAEATAEGTRARFSPPALRLARARTRSLRRSPLKRSVLDYDLIEVAQPDTAHVPNSGPTVASRTCMIVGKLVESAVLGLKQTLDRQRVLERSVQPARISESLRRIHRKVSVV